MNGAVNTNYNLLIINSLPGSGGHRLGRIFSCYDSVHWYSHDCNGDYPWTFKKNDTVKEAEFSKYHYDRILKDHVYVPTIGGRIKKYWDNEFWFRNWHRIMSNLPLPNGYLTFIVHDNPKYLRRLFPESIIVNLISNPEEASERHLNTSANYRIDYKLKGQLPNYRSKWVKARDELLKINPNATEKDIWMYQNNSSYQDYCKHIKIEIQKKNELNILEKSYADITLSWYNFDPLKYQEILGPINENYNLLL